MAGGMAGIRRFYGVPAKRGGKIRFNGDLGVIVGARQDAMHLLVRMKEGSLVGHLGALPLHPTWRVEYVDPPAELSEGR